jgi:hypothetical protein
MDGPNSFGVHIVKPLLEWIRDSCDTDRTTKWLPLQKINNFVLLWNDVFSTLKLANFVMWEKQPILFRAALNKIKLFRAAWEMLLFFWAAKNRFLTTISCSWNVWVGSTVRGLQKTLTQGIWGVFPKGNPINKKDPMDYLHISWWQMLSTCISTTYTHNIWY